MMYEIQKNKKHLYLYGLAHTNPAPKAERPLQKRKKKDCKNLKTRQSAVRLNLLEMTGNVHL